MQRVKTEDIILLSYPQKKNYPFQFISLQSNIHNLTIQLTFFQPKKKVAE